MLARAGEPWPYCALLAHFAHDLARRLVHASPEIHRVTKMSVRRPFTERDLDDRERITPMEASTGTRRYLIRERTIGASGLAELVDPRSARLVCEP